MANRPIPKWILWTMPLWLCIVPCGTISILSPNSRGWREFEDVRVGMTVDEVLKVYPYEMALSQEGLPGRGFMRERPAEAEFFTGQLYSSYPICIGSNQAQIEVQRGKVSAITGVPLERHKKAFSLIKVGMPMADLLEDVPIKFFVQGRYDRTCRYTFVTDPPLRRTFTGELSDYLYGGWLGSRHLVSIRFRNGRVVSATRSASY